MKILPKIIDNVENSLYEAITSYIDNSVTSVDIEVGYFYLCGFELLAEKIKDIPVRILVGSYIDPNAIPEFLHNSTKDKNTRLNVYEPRNMPSSLTARAEAFAEGIKKLANQSSIFDQNKSQKAYKILESKLENGTLEIKMTQNGAHGKYYVLNKKNVAGVVFMGSSNFTYNGLIGQEEINEVLETEQKYTEYFEKFNERWKDSKNIIIQEKGKANVLFSKIKNELWMNVVPTPYHMYLRILDQIFGREKKNDELVTPDKITGGVYSNYEYQLDAIKMGLDRLERYGGVIVADVVGLGKSVVASAIAANLSDLQTIVIAPPHLVPMWEDYVETFRLPGAKVFSAGKIEDVYNKYSITTRPLLIILDEAHRYRNEDTDDYQMLHKICRSNVANKVMVLSATPFNNNPGDMFAQIKFFQTPGQATLRTVENLSMKFKELEKEYKALRKDLREKKPSETETKKIDEKRDYIAREMRILIEPVIVRRTRIDLDTITRYREDLKRQNVTFSKIGNPTLKTYELGAYSEIYEKTFVKITSESFVGARYKPTNYPKNQVEFNEKYGELMEDIRQAQSNVASFMRKLLVMRFESSREAFRKTLQSMIGSNKNILKWIENRKCVPIFKNGYIPGPEDIPDEESQLDQQEEDSILEEGIEKARTINYKNKKIITVDIEDLNDDYQVILRSDLQFLLGIYEEWFGENSTYKNLADPKLTTLTKDIHESLANEPKRKIVVFSVYADTVMYVSEHFKKHGLRAFTYTSSNPKSDREVIRQNFDAGLKESQQKNDFDVIVATDAISEGFNLHRAGRIINFDIPYNPTRVIQRIGRINRINKKMFDELFVDNYFPTVFGEQVTGIKSISTLKIKIFNAVVGSDSKTLTSDEKLESFFIDEIGKLSKETVTWDTPHREVYDSIRNDEKTLRIVRGIPMRSRLVRTNKKEQVIVAIGIKGDHMVSAKTQSDISEIISTEQSLGYFKATIDDVGEKADDQFGTAFEIVKEKLFEKPQIPQLSGNRLQVKNILQTQIDAGTSYENYCRDLQTVIRDLDDIPEGQLKEIIKISKNPVNLSKSTENKDFLCSLIMEIAPEHQVKVSLERANKEELATNVILFSQEHRA